MKIMYKITEVRAVLDEARRGGKTIGLVPTMGYLHEGHLSLLRRAKQENEVVVISVFVNPAQFGKNEDYDSYPTDLKRDSSLAESAGADILFAPSAQEMYPAGYATFVEVEGSLTQELCGKQRQGHFKGVATVVSKLFHIVGPDRAYFGQKDAQQAAVIKQMVRDMNFPVEIVVCPTVRENDGLAMSSRNARLSETERKKASVLSECLDQAKKMIRSGERDADTVIRRISEMLRRTEGMHIEYVEIVSGETLKKLEIIQGEVLIALAVTLGRTRLIDNIRMNLQNASYDV